MHAACILLPEGLWFYLPDCHVALQSIELYGAQHAASWKSKPERQTEKGKRQCYLLNICGTFDCSVVEMRKNCSHCADSGRLHVCPRQRKKNKEVKKEDFIDWQMLINARIGVQGAFAEETQLWRQTQIRRMHFIFHFYWPLLVFDGQMLCRVISTCLPLKEPCLSASSISNTSQRLRLQYI